MADNTPVNSQITDAVTQANVKVVGEAPAQALGLVYQSVAHSMSLAIQSAQQSQGGMQQIGIAVVSSAVKNILDASGGGVGGGGGAG